ncbi:MAG: phosphatidylinositol-specific phospholipase C1-like protein [Acidimicrobiales bacterium]|nr:phosphatidylinositol-specific phospholipase C1-like protein [Acidimicrobiales bacterium]HRW37144.1 phosphatidylinositol-specific phospholipase C1-like protein [Aquihabitans sp.]
MGHRRGLAPIVAVVALVAALLAGQPASGRRAALDDDVRLNEVQVIGSHNSYKRMVSDPEEELRRSFLSDGANLMQYQHEPLPVQFSSQKVRQIELDVFLDSAGGLYADPLLRSAAGLGPYDPAMREPGIKVLHIQDVDYATTCLTFVACLQQIQAWSDANPSHLPIAVLVELKDDPLSFGDFTFTTPEPWTAAGMDELDDDIRSVMAPDDLITPDDVRGSHATLEDAVLTDGWPTLGESRGKVMFMMDNAGGYRSDYLAGHPSLEGRILFTNANPGDPDAAFVKRNDPFDASIPDLVRAGYLVRTRADADTVEAREEDTGPRDAALASGAQFVSTDYPVPGIAVGFTTSYVAEIPGGTVARCNPLIGPETCVDGELDTIYTPVAPPTTSTTVPTTSTTAPPSTTTTPPVAPGAQPVPGDARYTG